MRNYFEEMNIDYDELKRYEDIETYYDEVQDFTKLINELQCDRVEALKQIVNKNKEIERLNKELQDTKEHLGEYLHEQEEENKRLNNIINGMEKFFKYAYDNEVRPLNDRKVSVWTICLDKLQELKGSDK